MIARAAPVTPDACLSRVPLAALFAELRRRARPPQNRPAICRAGDLTLEVGSGLACWRGVARHLGPRETEVLTLLMAAHPQGLTGYELGERIWGETEVTNWALNARLAVRQLRRKLPALIAPLPQHGGRELPYRLCIEATDAQPHKESDL
jgi:DNA-binding response OmpR family regulator